MFWCCVAEYAISSRNEGVHGVEPFKVIVISLFWRFGSSQSSIVFYVYQNGLREYHAYVNLFGVGEEWGERAICKLIETKTPVYWQT